MRIATLTQDSIYAIDRKKARIISTGEATIIDFLNDSLLNSNLHNAEVSLPRDYKDQYFLAGIAYGFPGLFNIVLGYQFDAPIGIRASVSPLDENYRSLQFNLLFNLINQRNMEFNFSALTGYLLEGNKYGNYTFFGGGLDINIYNLHLNVFYVHRDSPSIQVNQIWFNIGFVYRFNKP